MNTLTHQQAVGLRLIRARLNDCLTVIGALTAETVALCDHSGSHPDCPVCDVWDGISSAQEALDTASVALDAALGRGPVPGKGGAR